MTIQEHFGKKSIKFLQHPAWRNNSIRELGRYWNKELKQNDCKVCGYNIHIEFAHIKAISSFPLTATLGEINAPDNVVSLCRNHHWELDNGYLTIEIILGSPTRN